MESVIYALPSYTEEIIDTVSHKKWLVHNFNITNEIDLYNPAEYLYNSAFESIKYNVVLDLNVYQFLLKIFKKSSPKPEYRNAAALLVFCQIANVEIDPTCSVYERVNYKKENLLEAVQELELFHQLNNSEMEHLAEYALGFSDKEK